MLGEIFYIKSWEIAGAFFQDFLIGDPAFIPHPVVAIGKFIEKAEKFLRKISFLSERAQGVCLFFITTSFWFLIAFLVVYGIREFQKQSPLLVRIFLEGILIFFISQFLALKGLVSAGKKVENLLRKGEIEKARRELKALVGRDTERLSPEKIRIAVVESLAENLNDAVIAPLFYLALGGLPGLVLYKTVNTLDSMVGYKNERYRYFGWFSARMDDLFNYVPARIAGFLIVLATLFLKGKSSACRAFKIMLRDGRKHLSPNSGVPEAAMAGALGVKLGGPSTYGGVLVEKPYIGEDLKPDFSKLVEEAANIVILSSFFFLVGILMLRALLIRKFL